MLTTSNSISSRVISKRISPSTLCGYAANHVTQKYDNVSISGRTANSSDATFMNTVSRISQEVRTATTTADIRNLHQEVQSGSYTPNCSAIAHQILYFSEE